MKLLSVAVPCYNSQGYMNHCIETLLTGGEELEILIVDDGSTDNTAAIADGLEKAHPTTIRTIHQKNAGHGGAVNTGMAHATGLYFRVVDSDDWVDENALQNVLAVLRTFAAMPSPPDVLVTNYIYDKVGVTHKKTIHYTASLPQNQVLSWDQVGRFHKGEYLLMHALTYRTELLRRTGFQLPLHTFYVDNLFAYTPLAAVKSLYYLNVDLYHYYIGREDQSVQEATMIRRIDQQLSVNRLMLKQVNLPAVENRRQQNYLFSYLEIITTVSSIMLIRSGTEENLQKKQQLWADIRRDNPWEYRRLRRGILGIAMNLPGKGGRKIASFGYDISQKLFGFN